VTKTGYAKPSGCKSRKFSPGLSECAVDGASSIRESSGGQTGEDHGHFWRHHG
jgi:hypothetical protein